MKIFGWEWDCGCPDRVEESGTNNPLRYWLVWWPLHHGLIAWLDRKLRWPGRNRGCCGRRTQHGFWCCDGHNPGD